MAKQNTSPLYRIVLFNFQSVREKPYPDEERVKGDPARDLAIIHHLCETHLRELQDFAKSQVISVINIPSNSD